MRTIEEIQQDIEFCKKNLTQISHRENDLQLERERHTTRKATLEAELEGARSYERWMNNPRELVSSRTEDRQLLYTSDVAYGLTRTGIMVLLKHRYEPVPVTPRASWKDFVQYFYLRTVRTNPASEIAL